MRTYSRPKTQLEKLLKCNSTGTATRYQQSNLWVSLHVLGLSVPLEDQRTATHTLGHTSGGEGRLGNVRSCIPNPLGYNSKTQPLSDSKMNHEKQDELPASNRDVQYRDYLTVM